MATLSLCSDKLLGKQASPASYSIWKNVTKVKDYTNVDPNGLDPYHRYYHGYPCDPVWCGDYSNNQPMCDIPTPDEIVSSNITNSSSLAVTENGLWNTYELSASVPVPCPANEGIGGWKAVAARKIWQGCYGKISRHHNYPAISDYMKWDCSCGYNSIHSSPDIVRYRSLAGEVIWSQETNDKSTNNISTITSTAKLSVEIDKDSGQQTTLSETSTVEGGDYNTYYKFSWDLLGACNNRWNEVIVIYTDRITELTARFGTPSNITTDGATNHIIEWNGIGINPDGSPLIYTSWKVELDMVAHSMNIYAWSQHITYEILPSSVEEWRVSDTTYTYNYTEYIRYDPILYTNRKSITGTLGAPYTATECKEDAKTLLAYWDLTNDIQHPWRVYTNTLEVPYVSKDELYGTPSLDKAEPGDPDLDYGYTGETMGRPAPEGVDMFWDARHQNFDSCDGTTYLKSYGEYSTEIGVPCATQWLSSYDAQFNRQGYYEEYRTADNAIWIQKWAEQLIPRPPLDLVRPCGKDKYLCDEHSASCVSSNVDTTITTTRDPLLQTGEYALVYGVTGLDGVWQVTRNSETEYVLSTLMVSGSQLPSLPYNSGKISKIRWWGIPSICGHQEIDDITGFSPVTCSFTDDVYVTDGETIRVNGCQGVTGVNGSWKVKRIDANNLCLVGSSGTGNYTGGGYIYNLFAKDSAWHKTESEGKYVVYEFVSDPRFYMEPIAVSQSIEAMGGECSKPALPQQQNIYQGEWGLSRDITSITCTEGTKKQVVCGLAVVCISPNGEKFGNGVTHTPTNSIKGDGMYGDRVSMFVKQHMDDPYFMAYYPNCSYGAEDDPWEEDSGWCNAQYPHRDQFEALCGVPEGAPPLPTGLYIGCLTQEQVNVPNKPAGNICNETAQGVMSYSPWILANNQIICICGGGSFTTEYTENGMGCI